MSEGPGNRVDWVVVSGIRDNVDAAVAAADRVLSEPDRAIGKALAVGSPIGIAPPAVVDWVSGPAGEVAEVSPGGVVDDGVDFFDDGVRLLVVGCGGSE